MLKLSIVIPMYNEEYRISKTLYKIISYLDKEKYDYEIILVDDGSKDQTLNVIRKLTNDRIRIISNTKNNGKGYVVRQGIMAAKKEWILFSDADLSTPIEELETIKNYIHSHDVVIGSRALKDSNILVYQPFYRAWSGKIFNLIVKLLAVRGIQDTQCGFKIFSKDAAQKIFSKQRLNGFGFDVEVLYLARKYGYKIKEVPVTWIDDANTKVGLFKDSIRMFADILAIRLNNLKGKYKQN
jgi:dolichyl-phosphate beta-glucosyltransferase